MLEFKVSVIIRQNLDTSFLESANFLFGHIPLGLPTDLKGANMLLKLWSLPAMRSLGESSPSWLCKNNKRAVGKASQMGPWPNHQKSGLHSPTWIHQEVPVLCSGCVLGFPSVRNSRGCCANRWDGWVNTALLTAIKQPPEQQNQPRCCPVAVQWFTPPPRQNARKLTLPARIAPINPDALGHSSTPWFTTPLSPGQRNRPKCRGEITEAGFNKARVSFELVPVKMQSVLSLWWGTIDSWWLSWPDACAHVTSDQVTKWMNSWKGQWLGYFCPCWNVSWANTSDVVILRCKSE